MNEIIRQAAQRFIDATIAQIYQDRAALTSDQYAAAESLAVTFGLYYSAGVLRRVRELPAADDLRRG